MQIDSKKNLFFLSFNLREIVLSCDKKNIYVNEILKIDKVV